MAGFSLTTRRNIAVLVPEVVFAPMAAIGAVYAAKNMTPGVFNSIKDTISRHIVQPHQKFFDSLGGGIQKAHEQHDREKRKELAAAGLPLPPEMPATTAKERADTVADTLTSGLFAMGADFAVTFAGQHVLNKVLKAGINASKTAMLETSVHLGGILAMPTLLAGVSENIHHGLSNAMRRVFGMNKDVADDVALPYTYVTLPGQLASLISLRAAHKQPVHAM